MILNISGRTDVVNYYMEWLINRIKEGYLDVRNPFYKKLVSRIYIKDVDLYFFITKNPKNLVDNIQYFLDKPILVHVTLTPYKKDIEPHVIDKKEIIENIKKLSNIIGKDNVVIRYDPVFLSNRYNLEYHKLAFSKLTKELNGYVSLFIISFLDIYKNVEKNRNILNYREIKEEDYKEIGTFFSEEAHKNNMEVQTCFEDRDLTEYGFKKGDCISKELAFKMTGKNFKKWRARKVNKCNCVELVDVGEYNTCLNFCRYCYANFDENLVKSNYKNHDKNSSLLVGHLEEDDIIKIRR